MKSTPTDPRALRTRQSLRDALMEVVVDKPFRDLTITDITKCAGINRATFYLHYEDKYALLDDCAFELFSEIRNSVEAKLGFKPNLALPEPFADHHKQMNIVLQHIQKHSDFYKAMFANDGDPLFYNLFLNNASTWIMSVLKDITSTQNRCVDDEVIEMMVRFQSSGNFAVISWWLENDMRVPIEILAKRLAAITVPPMIRMLEIDLTDL